MIHLFFSKKDVNLNNYYQTQFKEKSFNKRIKILITNGFLLKKPNKRIILMTTKAKKEYYNFNFKPQDTLLFGRESAGVPQIVHKNAYESLKIPLKYCLKGSFRILKLKKNRKKLSAKKFYIEACAPA